MIIFIKKIKTKEGINSIDMDKIMKDIPSGYIASNDQPTLTVTANHLVISFNCTEQPKSEEKKAKVKAKAKAKAAPKTKKVASGKA